MASRRTFLKTVGVIVGAGAVGGPEQALGAAAPNPRAVQQRSGVVFLGDAGGDPRVVCTLVTTNLAKTRQMIRRARRKLLTSEELANDIVLQPGSVSLKARALVYRQLSRVVPSSMGGFEVFAVSVPNAWRWQGSELELYEKMVAAALELSGLARFKRVSLFANGAFPEGARGVLTGSIRLQFANRYQPVQRFDIFPDSAKKHEGLQAARWAAFAIQQKLAGQTGEWAALLKQHIKKEVDLSVTL